MSTNDPGNNPGNDLDLSLNLEYVDDLYSRYRNDPGSIDPSWRRLFDNGVAPSAIATNGHGATTSLAERSAISTATSARYERVYSLVNAYRVRGHLEAQLDPLDHLPRENHPDLDPRTYGFTDADMEQIVPSGGLYGIA